jgi:hypothetical protein
MQPVFISSSDKGSDKIRLGDRYERFLKGLPHKQEIATPQEEHLRLAMTTGPSKESDLLSEGQYLYLAFSLEIAIL